MYVTISRGHVLTGANKPCLQSCDAFANILCKHSYDMFANMPYLHSCFTVTNNFANIHVVRLQLYPSQHISGSPSSCKGNTIKWRADISPLLYSGWDFTLTPHIFHTVI